jgi:hypothetical protein
MEQIVVLLVDRGQNHVFAPLLIIEFETLAPSWVISDALAHPIFCSCLGEFGNLGSDLGDMDFSFCL